MYVYEYETSWRTELLHECHVEADGDVREEGVDGHEGEGAGVGESVSEGSLEVS